MARRAALKRDFRKWTTKERERLLATGIPLAFWESYENWGYFLDHGYLEDGSDPSRFDIDTLSESQADALLLLVREWRGDGTEEAVERYLGAVKRRRA